MKILLLTDVPPCTNFTAGIFLNQLVSFRPVESIACFNVLNRTLDPIFPSNRVSMQLKTVTKPREDWGVKGTKWSSFISWGMEHLIEWRDIPQITKQVDRFGKEVGAEVVWCILQGQTMIRLAHSVARHMRLPLLTQVWDPPGWWMRANKVHPTVAKDVLDEFGEVLHSSAATATASWAMADAYKQSYEAFTIPFLPCLSQDLALSPAKSLTSSPYLTIGMAGQIYATSEWNALINALGSVDWRIGEREVRIRLLGRWAGLAANSKMNIEFLGWHSQEETISLLGDADILYCPYWFDPAFETEARLSFPSKLTTYLAAGRPVLFHGPEYSSPAGFLNKWQAGECCYSLEPEAIIASLKKLVTNEEYYRNVAEQGSKAFQECLTLPELQKNFEHFLESSTRNKF